MSLRSPGLTLVAVFTLAIGVAANTTVFSYVDMMMLRPIPGAAHGERLVAFEGMAADGKPLTTSYRDFRDYRDRLSPVLDLALGTPTTLNIGAGDRSSQVWSELVSTNYFVTLGIRPALGRLFRPGEDGDASGAAPVVVLGYNLWKTRFSGDPHVIGTSLVVNRQPMTIIGIAPADFHGSMPALYLQMWVPVTMAPQLGLIPATELDDRSARAAMAIARLRPGGTIARARAECSAASRRLAETEPSTNTGIGSTVLPVPKGHFGGQATMEGPLRILMTACGLVFLIVCANVANLLLARATTRRREFSLRMVMGGGRWRLARQLFAESLLLAVMGVLAGVPMAMWMDHALTYLMPRGANLPVSLDLPLNADILWFNVLICVVGCVVSGIAPALHGMRTNLNEALKESGRSYTEGRHSQRLSRALIVSEVAMALLAIIAAGLFGKSFDIARRINPGFDANNVLLAHLELSATGYEPRQRRELCEQLRSRLRARPGVVAVSWAETVPLWFFGGPVDDVEVEGYVPGPAEGMRIERNTVAPGYFDLLRIPIVAGRDFDEHDTTGTNPVLIVNQTFAKRYFPGREAVGRHVRAMNQRYTIVGVAQDCKYGKPTENAQPFYYAPFSDARYGQFVIFHIRTTGEPEQAAGLLRHELNAINPSIRLLDVLPMTESIRAGLYGLRMASGLLAALGIFSLALAVTGLYSVMAYAVAQRTQEIGIRMALGARPGDVLGMVVRNGMSLTLIGVAAGAAAAFAVTPLAASQLVHVSAVDPLIFAGASLLLTVVALAANYLPARRATRIDPNVTLRSQ
jgi:predicted permease